jgi:hypothetical protein
VKSDHPATQEPAMNARTVAVFAALVLAVLAVMGLTSQRQPVAVRELPAGLYDRVQLSVSAATARNEQATRLCESEINMILAREFPEIERAADRAAEEVSTYGSCTTIIYRLAKEQLGWSASTADYVEGEIRSRLQPSLDACGRELDAALARCELALKESTVTLASELAQANPSATGQPLDIAVDVRTSGDLDATLRGLGIGGGVLTIAGTFDAVAIMNTSLVRNLVAKIAQLAASIFAKPAATAAGSAAVAAADGPLPIGDALAIVGGLWTGYEIYATRAEFEQEIRASLTNALPEMKRSVHHQIMERIRVLQSDYQRAQDRIRNRLAANAYR